MPKFANQLDSNSGIQPARADQQTAQHEGQVSPILLRALAEVLQRRGLEAETALGPLAELLHADPDATSLSLARYQTLLARAIALSGDPAFALHCGLHASEASFGMMSPLVSHTASLRHAIAVLSQFHPLLATPVLIQLHEARETAELRCEVTAAPLSHDRGFIELMMAGLTRTLRAFGCSGAEIHQVRFPYPRPEHHAAYAAAFGGAERFGAPFGSIRFAAVALDRPHIHRHAELHAILLTHAQADLERGSRQPSCTERVRGLLQNRPVGQLPDLLSAARSLGLSERTLRRRLREEGTSFRELAQTRLYLSARTLLRDPHLTLKDVADALGFSDPTAFHRAFKRWAKRSPNEFRKLRGAS